MIADLSASFAVVDLEPAPDTRAMGLHRQQGDVLEIQKRFKVIAAGRRWAKSR